MKRNSEYRKARHRLTERIRYLRLRGWDIAPINLNSLTTRQMNALTSKKIKEKYGTFKTGYNKTVKIPGKDWMKYLEAKASEERQAKKYGFEYTPPGTEYFNTEAAFRKLLKGTVKRGKESYNKNRIQTWFKNSLKAWEPYKNSSDWRTAYLYELYKGSDPFELYKRIRKFDEAGVPLFDELYYQNFLGKPNVHNRLKQNAMLLIMNASSRVKFLDPKTTEKEWRKLRGI